MNPFSRSGNAPTEVLRRALLVYAALFLLFAGLALSRPSNENFTTIFYSALSGAGTGITLVYLFSNSKTDDAALRTLIINGVLIDVVCNFVATQLFAIKVLWVLLIGIANLGLLMAAIGVGLLVGRGLQKPNYLVMAAIVGAITDIFSVYAGPSKHLLGSVAFPYVALQWGLIGQGSIEPIVGAGDFIFLALYFYGARKFGLDDRRTLLAMLAAFVVGFLSTLFSPQGIPALPFMSAALLLVHGRELKAKMQES
jgi:hypothetical protein